jgi:hypothetical protein
MRGKPAAVRNRRLRLNEQLAELNGSLSGGSRRGQNVSIRFADLLGENGKPVVVGVHIHLLWERDASSSFDFSKANRSNHRMASFSLGSR